MGTRVPCVDPFAVCLGGPGSASVRVETTHCAQATADQAVDCTCNPNEVAVSGGTFSGSPNNMLNASQAAASYGGSPQVWRVACVDATGARVACVAPFAVCLGAPYSSAIRVDTTHCAEATADHAEDCTCDPTEVAISGGAYAGVQSDMLNASQAGPSYGASPQVWRVSCVDPAGNRVICSTPFAVCAANGI
jgi:hypothetical protein